MDGVDGVRRNELGCDCEGEQEQEREVEEGETGFRQDVGFIAEVAGPVLLDER